MLDRAAARGERDRCKFCLLINATSGQCSSAGCETQHMEPINVLLKKESHSKSPLLRTAKSSFRKDLKVCLPRCKRIKKQDCLHV